MTGSSVAAPRRTPWRGLYDFWARPIPAEPLALFRILIGTTILLSLLTSLGPNLARYLGPDGLCPGRSMDDWQKRTCRFCLLRGPTNLPPLDGALPAEIVEAWRDWCDAPAHALFLFGVLVAAVLFLTVGLFTRMSTFVAWALFVSFNQRLPWVINGGDSMMRCAFFYLLFAPSGAVWSLDRLRSRPRPVAFAAASEAVLIPAWPVRLMQIQLCLVYFFTGLSKLGQDWFDGEAVYWVLNDLSLTRWPYAWLPVPLFVCRLLSWGTLGFELGFSLGVLIPRLRPWVLLAGIAFHLGILIHTEVGWFSPATACWYALFLSGDGVSRLTLRRFTISSG